MGGESLRSRAVPAGAGRGAGARTARPNHQRDGRRSPAHGQDRPGPHARAARLLHEARPDGERGRAGAPAGGSAGMKVWEIMSRPVTTIPPDLPMKHVAAILLFFFYCDGPLRDLHSFPTRLSSD